MTSPQAQKQLKTLHVDRTRNVLPVLKRTPKFANYAAKYFEFFEAVTDAKRPATIDKERGAMRWIPHGLKPRLRKGRPGRCAVVLAVLWLLTAAPALLEAALPGSGPIVPELQPLEQAMTNFMAAFQYSAGTLALMKDSKLVLRTGYGWRDTNQTVLIHPDQLFRLASVSKTITGVAIHKLVNSGQLTYGTKVYPYLGLAPAGGVLGDSRITNITVQHLLKNGVQDSNSFGAL